jgi:hypothetical protein
MKMNLWNEDRIFVNGEFRREKTVTTTKTQTSYKSNRLKNTIQLNKN